MLLPLFNLGRALLPRGIVYELTCREGWNQEDGAGVFMMLGFPGDFDPYLATIRR